eukprot:292819-Pelagomonas_calceolata.AAC.1
MPPTAPASDKMENADKMHIWSARQTAEKYRGLSSSDVARGGLGSSSSYSSSSYSSSGVGSGWGGRTNGGSDGGGYSKVGGGGSTTTTRTRVPPPPEDENPFEATRKRIQQLRTSNLSAGTALDGAASHTEQFTPAPGSINMDASPNLFPGWDSVPGFSSSFVHVFGAHCCGATVNDWTVRVLMHLCKVGMGVGVFALCLSLEF